MMAILYCVRIVKVIILANDREIIEQIKSSIAIEKYIGRTITLTKKGGVYRGATTANSKSGASLIVDNTQQIYKNFAENDGGDIYNWIAFSEGLDIESDFAKILTIAAEYAGVTLPTQNPGYVSDKSLVYPLMSAVAKFYHSQLTDKCREYIHGKWGISDEMIDKLLIGWAPGSNELLLNMKKQFPDDVLSMSGLFYVVNNTKPGNDFFQNRIMFPYWKNGKVVYFIGRDPKWSKESNGPKYKKQMVHTNQEYVSQVIDNSVFYGEDSIKKSDSVIITEGVTDCIKVMQEGLPCISPVTVKIKDEQKEYAYEIVKNKSDVIICNDNEDNASGMYGAIATAEYLESKGVPVRVVELPRPNGVDKIDLAEYLQTHTKEDFVKLDSNNVWEIKLRSQNIPSATIEKNRAIKRFVLNDLKQMDSTLREIFIRNDVREYFGVEKRDISTLMKSIKWEDDETQGDDLDFFTGRGSLKTKKLGEYVMSLARFITFDDTKSIFVYNNGVYVPRGEEMISKIVQTALGDSSKKHHISEIINYIQLETLIPRSKINHDVYKINLLNGIYNLTSGQIEPHDPDYVSIVQLPINYDSDAECPAIEKFMSEVLTPNHCEVVYEIIAYCMVPDTKIEKSAMFLGKGANGKSVMISLISTFLGSKNISAESLQALETDPYSLAELYGKLANVFPDLASKTIYENSVFKMLTGNEHEIRGMRKYEHPFKFKNTARLIFSANTLPPAPNGDFAYYRRWIPIKFPHTFEGKDADKNLIGKLTTEQELSGLFNKCVSRLPGLLSKCEYSFDLSTEEVEILYKINSDPISAFNDEMIVYSDGYTLKNIMFQEYIMWCNRKEIAPVAENAFARRFMKLGYEAGRESTGNRARFWENCAVSEIRPGLDDNLDDNLDGLKTLSSDTINLNPSRLLDKKDHCNVENRKNNIIEEKNNLPYVNNRDLDGITWTDENKPSILQSILTRPGYSGKADENPDGLSLGDKMELMREICREHDNYADIIKTCTAIEFKSWPDVFDKMNSTGEIMVCDGIVRLV